MLSLKSSTQLCPCSHAMGRILVGLFFSLAATTLWAQSSTRGGGGQVYPSGNSLYPSPAVQGQRMGTPLYATPQYQQPVVQQPSSSGLAPGGSGSRPMQIGAQEMMVTPNTSFPKVQQPIGTFEQKLWNYLVRAKYRNWAPVPGKSDAMYAGQSPHGAHLKMYLNRKAAGSPKALPSGSMVIKENYGKDQKTLMAITAMYKNDGYAPQDGDWYWVKFNPDGSVANKDTDRGPKRLAGRVKGCIDCHDGADGNDYVFFNDEF